MENNIPWNIIIKDLKGLSAPEEKEILENWLREDDNHINIFSEIQNVYSLTLNIPPFFNPDKEKAWKKIDRQTGNLYLKVKTIFDRLKYTAAVVILLLVSFAFFLKYFTGTKKIFNEYSEIIAPPGQKSLVALPDSSYVWLNSGSSLKYSGNFNVKERKVILEGEAFFDVKKDETKKFRVQTGILTINVYGTAFNIKNYANDEMQEITVSEGKVGIAGEGKELVQLTPGRQAVLNKSTCKLSLSGVDPAIVSSWKNNELKFDNTSFAEVVKYMERWYGVTINIDPSMIGRHRYTFKIKTESLTEILEKIKLITPIYYEIDGKDVKIRYTH